MAPTATTECRSCAGYGWKYVTPRADVRRGAARCDGFVLRERRVCPDCRGADKRAAVDGIEPVRPASGRALDADRAPRSRSAGTRSSRRHP
jgi:hypothetical protein